MDFKTTADISVPEKLIDQIIGQKKAVEIIKKAAKQRRNVLLIGDPGTGKTMLAQAMSELMPTTQLEDVLVYKNPNDENMPLIKTVKTYPNGKKEKDQPGQGRIILQNEKTKSRLNVGKAGSVIIPIVIVLVIILIALSLSGYFTSSQVILFAALALGIMIFGSMAMFTTGLTRRMPFPGMGDFSEPKLIVDNTGMDHAPFIDATGSKAGALFGDVRHDPLQCIPQGETVLLETGNPTPIEKIVDNYFGEIGEGVVELNNDELKVLGGVDNEFGFRAAHVVRVYRRKYMGKLIVIKTRGGSKIRVTPNHPIAFLNQEGVVDYRRADTMKVGEAAIIPERFNTKKGCDIPTNMIDFIADALADGYVGTRRIEFNLKNPFKIETIANDIRKLGYEPKISTRNDGATKININSAHLCKHLSIAGIKEGNLKFIPWTIFKQDRETIIQFLSRLLSLDGYINKQGQFELLSSNKRFIQQVRSLLFTLGVNAKYKTRIDTGYGKAKKSIQHVLRWNDYEFAKEYHKFTVNPIHKLNINEYLATTMFNKESYDDVVPLEFGVLEDIHLQLDTSKTKVHRDYWSINPEVGNNTSLTRNLLKKVSDSFVTAGASGTALIQIQKLSTGAYAFDEITGVWQEDYEGFVYNLTTETGNYLVDFVLTHNSGGLGTPAHLRVESGGIHKANEGVLYIDEVSSMDPRSQQELLTAMQEKKYPITGKSEMSSGALVKTEPVPCDFLLIAAGNLQDIRAMHPALRSRIRGYGYEVFMDSTIEDTNQNHEALARFIAQEVKKDKRIPHFDKGAVGEIIEEARRRSGRKKRLTLVLRDLGGLVRAAGDLAIEKKKNVVTKEDVIAAKVFATPIEVQAVNEAMEVRKDYRVFETRGFRIGKVNGLAVAGSLISPGIVLPIISEVTPASSKYEGKFIPTGKLGKIASEAVKNVSAIIKKHIGKDISNFDMHVQFLQTYEGIEGDSASISVAVSILSAMENIPVNQSMAMTGSLTVRGEVLPVGGVTSKVEAAIAAGLKAVILPASNRDDVYLGKDLKEKIKLIPVKTFADVVRQSTRQSKRRDEIIKKLRFYEG